MLRAAASTAQAQGEGTKVRTVLIQNVERVIYKTHRAAVQKINQPLSDTLKLRRLGPHATGTAPLLTAPLTAPLPLLPRLLTPLPLLPRKMRVEILVSKMTSLKRAERSSPSERRRSRRVTLALTLIPSLPGRGGKP